MPGSTTLFLYFLMVFGAIALPGMDMAFIVGSSIVGGRRAGLAAVAGVTVGAALHMIFAVTGLFALIRLVPAALPLMVAVGTAYIAWLGWQLLRAGSFVLPRHGSVERSMLKSFLAGLMTCLMNPKAYLFLLAVLPQFIHPGNGPIWMQASAFGAITAVTQIAVYGSVAMLAATARQSLGNASNGTRWMARGTGAVLIAVAVMTVAAAWSGQFGV